MNRLFLIARIADEVVALPASDVGSVVEIDQIAPVPRVAPHIAGLFALRSRVLTVIDARAALGLPAAERTGVSNAVIVKHDGHLYAVLVDQVEDVVEAAPPEPCTSVLAPNWHHAASGVVRHADAVVLLIDPATLIAGPQPLAA